MHHHRSVERLKQFLGSVFTSKVVMKVRIILLSFYRHNEPRKYLKHSVRLYTWEDRDSSFGLGIPNAKKFVFVKKKNLAIFWSPNQTPGVM